MILKSWNTRIIIIVTKAEDLSKHQRNVKLTNFTSTFQKNGQHKFLSASTKILTKKNIYPIFRTRSSLLNMQILLLAGNIYRFFSPTWCLELLIVSSPRFRFESERSNLIVPCIIYCCDHLWSPLSNETVGLWGFNSTARWPCSYLNIILIYRSSFMWGFTWFVFR